MIHTTRWSPDTCGCVLDYTWDDEVPSDRRVHAFGEAVRTCVEHMLLTGKPLYDTVFAENQRKNRVLALAQERISHIAPEHYVWRFLPGRALEVSFPEVVLTQVQKNAVQQVCDQQFGAGRVVVL